MVALPGLLSSFGSYPNPLMISDLDRQKFHPVVIFPHPPVVSDLSDRTTKKRQLCTESEFASYRGGEVPTPVSPDFPCSVGRFDEDREGMYESDLFRSSSTTASSHNPPSDQPRTVHMGLDLAAPVGTPVYAFCAGTIVSAGYNPEWGDYGYVIVVRHNLPSPTSDGGNGDGDRCVYALYGHLSAASTHVREKANGTVVCAGDCIGWVGGPHENGGWLVPHVHFQLALHEPPTHDMPGVVSPRDRDKALEEYLDPRYVLGALY